MADMEKTLSEWREAANNVNQKRTALETAYNRLDTAKRDFISANNSFEILTRALLQLQKEREAKKASYGASAEELSKRHTTNFEDE